MISIIIPYHNRPVKLKRCLNSVFQQTYQDFEILIIDDYSKTPLQLEVDNRVRILRNSKNLGPGLSRNVGLDNAKGEYIAFLDSDDYWDKEFLALTTKALNSCKSLAFVYTNTIAVGKNFRRLKRNIEEHPNNILPDILINKRSWATSACLWNKESIGNTKFIETRNWEDYTFDIEVALKINKIKYIDEKACFYDLQGEDKLSQRNYLDRNIEKVNSLLKIQSILIYTKYINNKKLKNKLIEELITSFEILKVNNYKNKPLYREILEALKKLQNPLIFILLKLTYFIFNKKIMLYIFNKLKKRLY